MSTGCGPPDRRRPRWDFSGVGFRVGFRFFFCGKPEIEVKHERAQGGCLGSGKRRRTWQAAISFGEAQTAFDPEISEWGNPTGVIPCHRRCESIARRGERGELKHLTYPQEKKSTEIPLVAASERGSAQTSRQCPAGVVGPPHGELVRVGERSGKSGQSGL